MECEVVVEHAGYHKVVDVPIYFVVCGESNYNYHEFEIQTYFISQTQIHFLL